jgi:2'-deoxynucleoside 5'-phosphate N-hydrolase
VKKIYFACSISGGRDHAHLYEDIVAYIRLAGATPVSEIFADKKLVAELGPTPHLTPHETWSRDCDWVRQADAVIAEVTQPSLGVGYEIGRAQSWKKPILALFYTSSGRRLSPMISGNPHVQVVEYAAVHETKVAIKKFIENL